jgi:hypothetical protein
MKKITTKKNNMKHKLINTKNYLLVVSDEQIKKDDWVYNEISKEIYQFVEINVSYEKKIIAHLPLNNYPILFTFYSPNVWVSINPVISIPLLPPLEPLEQEYDVEKLAKEYSLKTNKGHLYDLYPNCDQTLYEVSFDDFKAVYNKARENFKYTERQLDVAIDWAIKKGREGDVTITDIDNFIQSLSLPKMPVAFKCEVEWINSKEDVGNNFTNVALFEESINQYDAILMPKTTTTPEGQTIWVGEYIY